jgi:hypothetical protein
MSTPGRSFPNAPFKDPKQAFEFLNLAHWNLRITSKKGKHDLWGGDGELHLVTTSTEQELWAFVLGMALTFLMIGPDELPGFDRWSPGPAPQVG